MRRNRNRTETKRRTEKVHDFDSIFFGFGGRILATRQVILIKSAYTQPLAMYEGGSICNENSIITPSTNALGFYAICQTKDQSVAVIMVHEKLFHLTKFNKLQTF